MVFANGKNNLEPYIFKDVNEMESIGSTERMNVVVQYGSYKQRKVVRFKVAHDQDPNRIGSPILQDLGNSDMGDWRQVAEFAKWSIANFPARRYFLVIGDHGAGWRGNGDDKTLSHDDITGHALSSHQLGLALGIIKQTIGKNIDIYGSDACLMQMAEVAGEAYNAVNYFVGSQELEPGEGWPYHLVLKNLDEHSTAHTRGIVQATVRAYAHYYASGTEKTTLSGINVAVLRDLSYALKKVADQLLALPLEDQARVQAAFDVVERYYYEDYGDLADLVMRLMDLKLPGLVFEDLRALHRLVMVSVVGYARSSHFKRSYGMSIWIPHSGDRDTYTTYQALYRNMRFNRVTNWTAVLNRYIQVGAGKTGPKGRPKFRH
jgi:hypothetical protein